MIEFQGQNKQTNARTNMLYVDYEWDIGPTYITLDAELNTKILGWNEGDYFKVVEHAGKKSLVKVNKLEEFIIKGIEHDTGNKTS